jgi:hypothetical protein
MRVIIWRVGPLFWLLGAITLKNSTTQLIRVICVAQISKLIPIIGDTSSSAIRANILDKTLPAMHLLNLASSLDHALEEYIEINSVEWPKKTKSDLFNRIEVLCSIIPNLDSDSLHNIREIRNKIAHEADIDYLQEITWEIFEENQDTVLTTFITLGALTTKPVISAHAERTPTLYVNERGPNGERMVHSHRVWAEVDENIKIEHNVNISFR